MIKGLEELATLDAGESNSKAKGAVREQVLQAAQDLVTEGGYESVTIRKVAERISRSPMSLYHHFATKEEILVAVAREIFSKIGATLPKVGGDALRTLHGAMPKYIEFGLNHPREYELLFLTRGARSSGESPGKLIEHISNRAGGRNAFRRMLEYVEAGLAAGVLRGDCFKVSTVLWAGIHGCVSLLLTHKGTLLGSPLSFAEATVTTLLRGICVDRGGIVPLGSLEGEMTW